MKSLEEISRIYNELEKMEIGSIIEIETNGNVKKYKVTLAEHSDRELELISLTEFDLIWNDYPCGEDDKLENVKIDLMCDFISDYIQNIKVGD